MRPRQHTLTDLNEKHAMRLSWSAVLQVALGAPGPLVAMCTTAAARRLQRGLAELSEHFASMRYSLGTLG